MVDVIAQQQALIALAARLAQIAPPRWAQVYLAFETHPDGPDATWAILGAVEVDTDWAFGQFDQDPEVHDLAVAFREVSDPAWTMLELKVTPDGAVDSELGYDGTTPGEAFSPELMERLENYPATFRAEFGERPGGQQPATSTDEATEQAAPPRKKRFWRR